MLYLLFFEEDANIYQIISRQIKSINNFFKTEYNEKLFDIEDENLNNLNPIITNNQERYQNYCLLINKIIFEKLNYQILQTHLSKIYNFTFAKDYGKVNTIKKLCN